jgi:sigma-B regulation protein RsbU (phosphoserine phosphatase)
MFVTLALGVLDLDTGRVEIVSAGHEPPVLVPPGADAGFREIPGGPALGLNPGAEYTRAEIAMAPGDRLVLYTDGVTEAFDAGDEAFGTDRLRESLSRHRARDPGQLTEAVLGDLAGFVADAPPSDDITLFTLCFHGPGRDA